MKKEGVSPQPHTTRSRFINLDPGTNNFRAIVDELKNVGGEADGCDGIHGCGREAGER
jgi:hypothetical protein